MLTKKQVCIIHSVRFTAVLDTNVIYPVIIRYLLFWFAYYELYTPKWSEHIFDEWKRVMSCPPTFHLSTHIAAQGQAHISHTKTKSAQVP